MKFTISDILWTTTAASFLFLAVRHGDEGLVAALVILALLLLAIPLLVVFATICFGEQKGQTLDHSTIAGWATIKKIWFLSIICFVVVVCLSCLFESSVFLKECGHLRPVRY